MTRVNKPSQNTISIQKSNRTSLLLIMNNAFKVFKLVRELPAETLLTIYICERFMRTLSENLYLH